MPPDVPFAFTVHSGTPGIYIEIFMYVFPLEPILYTSPMLYLLYLILLLLLWRTTFWNPRKLSGVTRASPLLLGHRGVRGERPENTLVAFELAFESGLDGLECDVQRTSDGELILFHDFEIREKKVSSLNYHHLKSIDPRIPKVAELLELAKQYPGTLLNLELKSEAIRTDGLERDTLRLVKKYRLQDRVIVSSFSPVSLVRVRLLDPSIRTGLLYSPDMPWWGKDARLASWLHVDALHPYHQQVTPEMLSSAHRRGLAVNTWTVNDEMRISSLCSLKVDAIIGDSPTSLLSGRHVSNVRGDGDES
jgi:glycerophosphoryl diester phosphodiesterase